MPKPAMLTTEEAAAVLKVSRRRVLALIGAGRLEARQFGRAWLIERGALAAVRARKPGRPKEKSR